MARPHRSAFGPAAARLAATRPARADTSRWCAHRPCRARAWRRSAGTRRRGGGGGSGRRCAHSPRRIARRVAARRARRSSSRSSSDSEPDSRSGDSRARQSDSSASRLPTPAITPWLRMRALSGHGRGPRVRGTHAARPRQRRDPEPTGWVPAPRGRGGACPAAPASRRPRRRAGSGPNPARSRGRRRLCAPTCPDEGRASARPPSRPTSPCRAEGRPRGWRRPGRNRSLRGECGRQTQPSRSSADSMRRPRARSSIRARARSTSGNSGMTAEGTGLEPPAFRRRPAREPASPVAPAEAGPRRPTRSPRPRPPRTRSRTPRAHPPWPRPAPLPPPAR